jgi:hypothetical protein
MASRTSERAAAADELWFERLCLRPLPPALTELCALGKMPLGAAIAGGALLAATRGDEPRLTRSWRRGGGLGYVYMHHDAAPDSLDPRLRALLAGHGWRAERRFADPGTNWYWLVAG